MSRASHWTDEDIQRLRRLAKTGLYSVAELAQLTQRSLTNTRLRLARMGLEARPAARAKKVLSADQVKLLTQMAERGFSIHAMRQKSRLSEDVIRRTLAQALGKPYRQPAALVREKRADTIRAHLAAQPERVKNDHLGHCLAVLRANNGCGFPAYDIPPKVRIAA